MGVSFGSFLMYTSMGNRKDAVLPEPAPPGVRERETERERQRDRGTQRKAGSTPVLAMPMMSRPCSATGIAAI
jgi:hypothetical protein